MASKPRVLILTGYGLNCEAESRFAWEQAGADADLVHLRDFMEQPSRLHDYGALMFIGGFSFGDHMGSGHVFAARIRHHVREDLQRFIDDERLVLGVCNGFQIMVKLGLLPGLDRDFFTPRMALIQNDCGTFQNDWVHLRFEPGIRCVFTQGLDNMSMPIRHGEGKLFTPDAKTLARVQAEGHIACRYVDPTDRQPTQRFPHNPNGSQGAIAGLCDQSGRVMGLMPHPEAFLFAENHPTWQFAPGSGHGTGLRLFENAVRYLRG